MKEDCDLTKDRGTFLGGTSQMRTVLVEPLPAFCPVTTII
ncbi:unnamed protein product [Schistosoma mattheei]|uniref:Uncharacterized protein n=1 Tax=Schistosoma mattheei TaxID=31246 RepID=A0A183PS94_9TREM|nr:unnamed protein product [Schistosoma mattheei]